MDKPKLSPPNEKGFQFGINENLTKYSHKLGLKISALEVWKDDKFVSFLLVDEKTNDALKDCQGIEAAACALDMYHALKQHGL